MTTPTLLDLAGVAEVAGVQYRTMRNYHQTAERNRRLAEKYQDPSLIRPGDLPKPDGVPGGKVGRSPVWKSTTIEEWMRTRPGRGAGGGRPPGYSPKKETEEE
jgi:hypothetical protein